MNNISSYLFNIYFSDIKSVRNNLVKKTENKPTSYNKFLDAQLKRYDSTGKMINNNYAGLILDLYA